MPMDAMGRTMSPATDVQEVLDPQNTEQVYASSFVSVLTENLGYYVVVEFLIGTSGLVQKEGILYNAGNNFITLYQSAEDRHVVCDLYSIKFVTFYDRHTPPANVPQQPQPTIPRPRAMG